MYQKTDCYLLFIVMWKFMHWESCGIRTRIGHQYPLLVIRSYVHVLELPMFPPWGEFFKGIISESLLKMIQNKPCLHYSPWDIKEF